MVGTLYQIYYSVSFELVTIIIGPALRFRLPEHRSSKQNGLTMTSTYQEIDMLRPIWGRNDDDETLK